MKKIISVLVVLMLVLNLVPKHAAAEDAELKEVVLSNNDFESSDFASCISGAEEGYENASIYTGGDVKLDGADFNVTQNNAAVVAAVADPDPSGSHGRVLMIEGNDKYTMGTVHPTYITYCGPGYMPAKKSYSIAPKQRIVIEFDMYVNEKRAKSGNFTLRSTLWGYPTSRTDELHFYSLSNSGSLSTINGEFEWQEKTWHKIRAYMNMDERKMDLNVDGNMIVENYAISPADIFDTTGVATIKFAFGLNSGIQRIYMDNVKISVMVVPPKISLLSFKGKDGTESDTAKGYDTDKIVLKCSETILKESVENHLSLVWKRGDEDVDIPFELDFPKEAASEFVLNLNAPLRENESYVLIADAGFESDGGNVNPAEQSIEFKTLAVQSYVKSLEDGENESELVFVNLFEEEISLRAVIAVYDNGNLTYMHYKNLSAMPGENILNIDTTVTASGEKKIFICNDRFVPYYIGK